MTSRPRRLQLAHSPAEPHAPTGISVRELHVAIAGGGAEIVRGISFDVAEGEVLGLVGESGSGKTTLALALLGFARPGLEVTAGSVSIAGQRVTGLPARELASVRGRLVAYVPQDAGAALNPALTIGSQLREMHRTHAPRDTSAKARGDEIGALLERVKLAQEERMLRRYPHQLSGGQQQRLAIAMAFAARPRAVILDEPTTGLDVVTQQSLLELIREIARVSNVAIVYVSHDISVVQQISERIAVMYSGRIVEQGPQAAISSAPAHPYTEALLRCIPRISSPQRLVGIPGSAPAPSERPAGCAFAPRCPLVIDICSLELPPSVRVSPEHVAECQRAGEQSAPAVLPGARRGKLGVGAGETLVVRSLSAWHGSRHVLYDVDFELAAGQSLAIVGESGSGKTTLAKAIIGLHSEYTGEIRLGERKLARAAHERSGLDRRTLQYVFQNPYGSLNPRRTVAQILAQPARLFPASSASIDERVLEALERVRLSVDHLERYPRQLSGGERQRVAIARSLIARPSFLICDEVTASLDVSVQATIVDLLLTLSREIGVGLIFITHQLPLVQAIAASTIVIAHGRISERGATSDVISDPQNPYTVQLLEAARTIYG